MTGQSGRRNSCARWILRPAFRKLTSASSSPSAATESFNASRHSAEASSSFSCGASCPGGASNGLESAFRFFQCLDCRGELLAEPGHDAGEVVPLGRLEALQRRDEPLCERFHVRQDIGRQDVFSCLNPSHSPLERGIPDGPRSSILEPRSCPLFGGLPVDRRFRHVQLGGDLDLHGSNLESGVLFLRDEGRRCARSSDRPAPQSLQIPCTPRSIHRACMRQGLQAAAGLRRMWSRRA